MYHLFVLLLSTLMSTQIKSLHPDCRCYLFDSRFHLNGTFKSPNYNILHGTTEQYECIIYTFKAKLNEIVHITFINFHLLRSSHQQTPSHQLINNNQYYHDDDTLNVMNRNFCSEYVRIFDKLESNELNIHDIHSYELCGSFDELVQHHYISEKHILIMEARLSSATRLLNLKYNGFSGKFIFEPRNRYTNDGQHVIGTICDHLIKSPTYEEKSIPTMTPNRSIGKLKYGYFFSPRYPQNYPPNIMCNIYLIGQPYERVVINLLDIDLKSVENSGNKLPPVGDHLQIYEAKQTISPTTITSDSISYSSSLSSPSTTLNAFYHNQNKHLLQSTEIIQYIYGQIKKDVQIISKGPHMLITFISNNDGKQSRGFEAKYRFVHKNQVRPTIKNNHLSTNDNNDEETIKQSIDGELLLRKSSVGGNASRMLNIVPFDVASKGSLSVQHRKVIQWNKDFSSGLIYSPNYPKAYPPNKVNEYVLMAPPKGRVQITVGAFQLDERKTSSCRSHVGDRIEIYSNTNTNIHPWIILCGVQISPEYKFIESLTNYLLLRFISDSVVSNTEKGFQLYYKFINDNISNSFIDTVTKINTNATNKNLSSHYNHQESIQLESNLLDEHVYQFRQYSNSIVVSPFVPKENKQIVGNKQDNAMLLSSKKWSKFIHGNSEVNRLNIKQEKCSYVIEDNHQQEFSTFQSLNLKETILKHYDSFDQSKTNHDSILCKWILIGRPYQRVQVRLVSKIILSNNNDSYGRKRHYESFTYSSNQHISSNQSISINHPNVNTITSSIYNGPKIGYL
ncbi:hypothetical protein MN116_005648 [Schistosoma mekongi]|uniref:CUB domain-containing protein n=1 Tax=Schistosoma mekongi TaxID=38744 RepID=A0AAE2D453_SCHME|nr:hypothetical protein MN116_005648 [Schistosoma mekongi]